MAHDVFISHAQADKTLADMVCATLERHGLRCWIAPRDILPGADWSTAIVNAIRASRVMVLVFSDAANASPHVPREIERAIKHEIPIVPMRIENVEPRGPLEYSLSSVHWLDAITPPMEAHIARLAANLRVMLDIPPDKEQRTVPETAPSPSPPLSLPPRRSFPLRLVAIVVALAAVVLIAWNFLGGGPDAATTAANEEAAVSMLLAIVAAQEEYAATCGNGGWATEWFQLTTPRESVGSPFLPEEMLNVGRIPKSGYRFAIDPGLGIASVNDCRARRTSTGYYVTVVPETAGVTGTLSFATNASGVIWQLPGSVPPKEPFGPPATVAPRSRLPSNEVHVKFILMKLEGQDESLVRTRLERVLAKVRAGEDFDALAKQFSEDPNTAPKGGDIGFVKRGVLEPSVEEAAFSLGPGRVSNVITTPFGLMIVKVTERK